MKETIWKIKLMVGDEQEIDVPEGARFLCSKPQRVADYYTPHEALCVWAIVDPTAPVEKRTIYIRGTGHPMPDKPVEYLGTSMFFDDSLVLHVFVERRP